MKSASAENKYITISENLDIKLETFLTKNVWLTHQTSFSILSSLAVLLLSHRQALVLKITS